LAEQIITSANIEVGVIDKASAQMQNISNSFAGFNKTLSGLDKGLAITGAAIGSIGFLVTKFGRSAFQEAARVQELDIAMRAIGASTKIGYQQIQKASKAIRDNGIEMAASQQIAIEFAQNNLELARAADVARVAQDLAVIGQKNSTDTTMLLVRAIITGRTELLKSSGIQKSAGQMYEEYAQQIGKSTKALTAQEKQTAVINGVMKEGERVAGTYLAAMEAPGKVLRSFPRLFNDMKVEMGKAALDGFGPLIKSAYDMTSAFSKAIRNNEGFGKAIKGLGFLLNTVVTPLTNFLKGLTDVFKNMSISEDSIKKVIGTLYQFLPIISAVTVALSTFAGRSILSTIPGLSAFAGALNPIMAGFLALVATSPELRAEVMKLFAAFKPLIPVILQIAQALANTLVQVLKIVIPLVRVFAEFLTKFIPSAINFIKSNEYVATAVGLVAKGLLILIGIVKIATTVQAINAAITAGSMARAYQILSGAVIFAFKPLLNLIRTTRIYSTVAGIAATSTGLFARSLGLLKWAIRGLLVSTGIGALVVGLGFLADAAMNFFIKSKDTSDGLDGLSAETAKLDGFLKDLEAEMNKTSEAFDDGFDGSQQFTEGLQNMGDEADEAKQKAQELANRIKDLRRSVDDAVKSFNEFVAEQTDTRSITQKVSDAFNTMRETMKNSKLSADDLLTSFKEFTSRLQSDFSDALSNARSQLEDARRKFDDFRNVISSSIKGIVRFDKAVEDGDFLKGLIEQAGNATKFSEKVKKLIEMGLSQSAITQVVEAGYEAGTIIADQIIAGGQTVVDQVNKLVADVESVADAVGVFGAQRFYQAGVDQANALVNGILEQMNTRKSELEMLAKEIADLLAQKAKAEAALGATTTTGGGGGSTITKTATSQFVKGTSLTQAEVDKILKDPVASASAARYQAMANALTKTTATSVRTGVLNKLGNIPKMATGGVVTRPTLAMIGEKGPEAVVPLNKAGGMGGAVYNITVNAGIGTNGQEVGRQIVEAIKKFEKSSGPVFAKA
jgi:archaellum component FlaC